MSIPSPNGSPDEIRLRALLGSWWAREFPAAILPAEALLCLADEIATLSAMSRAPEMRDEIATSLDDLNSINDHLGNMEHVRETIYGMQRRKRALLARIDDEPRR